MRQKIKIRTGDTVKVISGADRGKIGKVIQVFPKEGSAVVEKVRRSFRHIRARRRGSGERIEFFAPLNISNLMLVCPKCSKPTRIGYKIIEDGTKLRQCKKCKETF